MAVAVVVAIGVALVARDGEGPEPRLLRGLSGQRLPVTLELQADRGLRALDVSWEGPCKDAFYESGIKRTSRRVAIPVRADGSFAWSGRHRVTLDGVDEDLRVPVRLAGRVRADGSVTATWRTGNAVRPWNSYERCLTMTTRLQARRGGPSRRTPQAGIRATWLDDGGSAVAVGGGQVWVLGDARSDEDAPARPTVAQVDPATGRVRARFDVRGGTLGAGATAAWLVGYEHRQAPAYRSRVALSRLDPGADRARPLPDRPPWPELNPDVNGLAITERAVWIMQDARLLQIDARSGRLIRTILGPRAGRASCERRDEFSHVAAGAGAVWVIAGQSFDCDVRPPPSRLLRLDPRSGRITRTIVLRHGVQALAAGPAGVWALTNNGVRQTVRRLDVRGRATDAVVDVPDESFPSAPVVGDQTVWMTSERNGRGVLQRLDPGARRTVVVRRLRGPASTVAVDGDTAWVVDRGTRELLRVTP